ncbi:uncharacterized protein [Watersipora subatra]|uniref:uncharacterized protein n=1 Tax=Watersipora subatra TaxID=2589382 RepID=UPI00355B3CD0
MYDKKSMGGNRDNLSSVECISIERRGFRPNRYYVYVVIVTWNNGDKHPIYRKYSSFYDFERMLREKHGNVGIPELPPMNVLEKAFRIEKNHVTKINEFCQKVIALPDAIVNSHSVIAFFEAWSSDYSTCEVDERIPWKKDDKKKLSESLLDKQDSDEFDQTENSSATGSSAFVKVLSSQVEKNNLTSAGVDDDLMGMEVYICVADYVPDGAEELSLNKGAKCIVLEKNGDGWWFIMRESDGHQGYAPGSFLSLNSPKATEGHEYAEVLPSAKYQITSDNLESVITVRAVTSYESKNTDEVSCQAGQELEVLEMDSSGWWTVRTGGKVGLVPAVHLEPTSSDTARSSQVILRNNSLYARNPPPRRYDLPLQPPEAASSIETDPAYISLENSSPKMAARRLVPPASKAEGILNYVEIAFDDEPNQPKLTKASTQALLAVNKSDVKKQDSIVYTQIVPRNLRKPDEPLQTSSANGKKPERGKALKKHPTPKIEEPKSAKSTPSSPKTTPGRNSPVSTKSQVQPQDSPIMAKPRIIRPQEPQHNYENHIIASVQPLNAPATENAAYSNIKLVSPPKQTNEILPKRTCVSETFDTAKTPNANEHSREKLDLFEVTKQAKRNLVAPKKMNDTQQNLNESAPVTARERLKKTVAQKSLDSIDYLRRSSIEPPPAPTVEAPIPSTTTNSHSSLESYSPSLSRAQAISSYDGPPISGMLMFTKGDIATVMSKTGDIGWWYVNLKGLEGYVPGGYWEACSKSASPLPRTKVPQPMPRNLSPPTSGSIYENEAWYHGKLSRPESEKLLANFSNGIYVIRESVNRVGDLTLSVRWEGKTRHFPIEAKDGGLFYIGKHDFKTLRGVITHYSKHALFYTEANEPVKLKTPATKTNAYSRPP